MCKNWTGLNCKTICWIVSFLKRVWDFRRLCLFWIKFLRVAIVIIGQLKHYTKWPRHGIKSANTAYNQDSRQKELIRSSFYYWGIRMDFIIYYWVQDSKESIRNLQGLFRLELRSGPRPETKKSFRPFLIFFYSTLECAYLDVRIQTFLYQTKRTHFLVYWCGFRWLFCKSIQ